MPQKSVVLVSLLPAHALKLQIIDPTANCYSLLWTQFLLADDSGEPWQVVIATHGFCVNFYKHQNFSQRHQHWPFQKP